MAADSIFVTALTTGPANVTVTSGSTTSAQTIGSAGVHVLSFDMGVGPQTFSLTTSNWNGSGRGAIDVSADCYVSDSVRLIVSTERAQKGGVYNFNILAGIVQLGSSGDNIGIGINATTDTPSATSEHSYLLR